MRTLKLVKYLVFITPVFFIATVAVAQSKTPRFSEYPVKNVYEGKNAPIKLKRDDMAFRTRLRWAAKHLRPNLPVIISSLNGDAAPNAVMEP